MTGNNKRSASGWLDVKVMIEIFDQDGAGQVRILKLVEDTGHLSYPILPTKSASVFVCLNKRFAHSILSTTSARSARLLTSKPRPHNT